MCLLKAFAILDSCVQGANCLFNLNWSVATKPPWGASTFLLTRQHNELLKPKAPCRNSPCRKLGQAAPDNRNAEILSHPNLSATCCQGVHSDLMKLVETLLTLLLLLLLVLKLVNNPGRDFRLHCVVGCVEYQGCSIRMENRICLDGWRTLCSTLGSWVSIGRWEQFLELHRVHDVELAPLPPHQQVADEAKGTKTEHGQNKALVSLFSLVAPSSLAEIREKTCFGTSRTFLFPYVLLTSPVVTFNKTIRHIPWIQVACDLVLPRCQCSTDLRPRLPPWPSAPACRRSREGFHLSSDGGSWESENKISFRAEKHWKTITTTTTDPYQWNKTIYKKEQ